MAVRRVSLAAATTLWCVLLAWGADSVFAMPTVTMPNNVRPASPFSYRGLLGNERFLQYVKVTGIDGDLFDITLGPDGAVWFTETASNAIGRMDAKYRVSSYPVPASAGVPVAITSGPDGNLWFTLGGGSQQGIGRITPAGVITIFPFGTAFGTELDITAGPDGNLWFTDFSNNMVGRVTPQGAIKEFALPTPGAPNGIVSGPDKHLWICEEGALTRSQNVPGRILRMTTAVQFKSYILSPPSWTTAPEFIAVGSDRKLWFTEQDQTAVPYHVESITLHGAMSEFSLLPTSSSNPVEPIGRITSGSDGNVWLTEGLYNVDRVTPSGGITRFVMPPPPGTTLPPQPRGITTGPDDNLWWVETSSGSIGILQP